MILPQEAWSAEESCPPSQNTMSILSSLCPPPRLVSMEVSHTKCDNSVQRSTINRCLWRAYVPIVTESFWVSWLRVCLVIGKLTIAQFSATCFTVCDFPVTALESFTRAECARRGVQMKDKNQKSVSCYLVVFTHIQDLNPISAYFLDVSSHSSILYEWKPLFQIPFYKGLTMTFSKKRGNIVIIVILDGYKQWAMIKFLLGY